MSKENRTLTPGQMAAAERIKRVWLEKKAALGLSQERAGAVLGWTQGAFAGYINKKRPLNVEAVLKFAFLLKEPAMLLAPEVVGHLSQVLPVPDDTAISFARRYIDASYDRKTALDVIFDLSDRDVTDFVEMAGKTMVTGAGFAAMVRETASEYGVDTLTHDERVLVERYRVLGAELQIHLMALLCAAAFAAEQRSQSDKNRGSLGRR